MSARRLLPMHTTPHRTAAAARLHWPGALVALAAITLAACSTVPQEREPLHATRMLELDLMPPVYELITPKPLEPASLGLHPSVKTIESLEARLPQGLRSEGAAVQSLYQTGQASWYGDKFHGRLTANGERYNMYAMTAAHRTLPFGTIVCVRSLQTSKEIKVRINDRGPYVGQRIIDLSRGAAEKLGMLSQGLKNVALWIPQKNGPQCGEDDVRLEGKGAPPPHNPPRGLSAGTPAQTPAKATAAKSPTAQGSGAKKSAKNAARKPAKGVAQRAAKSSAKKTQNAKNTKTPKAVRKPARANANAKAR